MAGLKSLKTFPFKSMLVILGVFLMIAVVLFAERSGIQYTEKNRKVAYLSQEEVVTEQMAAKSLPKTCLVLRNSEDEASVAAWEQFQQIFKDMKVGTDVVDLQSASSIPDYHAYETVVVLLSDVSPLKENLMELCDWVSEGGNVLFAVIFFISTERPIPAPSAISQSAARIPPSPIGCIADTPFRPAISIALSLKISSLISSNLFKNPGANRSARAAPSSRMIRKVPSIPIHLTRTISSPAFADLLASSCSFFGSPCAVT